MYFKKSCSSKKLYIVELGIVKKGNNGWNNIEYFETPIYIVAKAKNKGFKDIITKHRYDSFISKKNKDGEVIAVRARPIITTQKRFIYKDADKLIKSRNRYYKVK